MIEVMEGSEDAIVGLRVTGTLHEQDYAELLPKLEDLFAQHGKLSILFYADPDFHGWDMSAAWQDAALGFRHGSDFDRMAIVGAPGWMVWAARLGAFLLKGELRIFDADRLDEAWTWIRG